MAPSFRSRTQVEPTMATVDEAESTEDTPTRNSRSKIWERRRRRLANKKNDENSDKNRRRQSASLPEEELDPYESDPGESYREHCMKFKGIGTRSCLTMPKFLRKAETNDEPSVLTAPPSPLPSEMGDLFGQVPASLPSNLTRVRYSLRSSITDGSEKQPMGPSVMERRELRPNGVHLNVSHWSDEGGRAYMEDRYVQCVLIYL